MDAPGRSTSKFTLFGDGLRHTGTNPEEIIGHLADQEVVSHLDVPELNTEAVKRILGNIRGRLGTIRVLGIAGVPPGEILSLSGLLNQMGSLKRLYVADKAKRNDIPWQMLPEGIYVNRDSGGALYPPGEAPLDKIVELKDIALNGLDKILEFARKRISRVTTSTQE